MPSYVRAGIRKCARIRALSSPEERFCALLLELMERCYDTGRTSVCLPKTGASGSEAPPDAIMGRIEHSITWMGVGDWSMREHAPGK